jgi:hypothetical protein
MLLKNVVFWSALTTVSLGVSALHAADGCCGGSCSQGTTECGKQCGGGTQCGGCATQTVLVPEWVNETRKIKTTECVPEIRQRKFTATRCVAETKNVEREHTVMAPQTRTRKETYTVQVPATRNVSEQYQVSVAAYRDVQRTYTVSAPVQKERQEQYTVMTPHTETRHATRQIAECVPVSETRTRCVDRGHWEQPAVAPCACETSSCATCGASCGATCDSECGATCGRHRRHACCESSCNSMVWVAKPAQEQDQVTVMKRQVREEPYDYCVTVCKPETRTRTVQVCSYENQQRSYTEKVCEYRNETRTRTYAVTECKMEERTRDVQYTEYVPQKRTCIEQVVSYRNVPEEKTENYTVMVSHEVEKDVCVQVCHMAPKQVGTHTCCANACDSNCCARRGRLGRWRR